ncbi:MAG: molecular chaperone DnaJ, partial [Fibrobacterales bacterium]
KEAAEAYEVLSDDQKRAQYDRFGHDAGQMGGGGGGFGRGFSNFEDIFSSFGDIFGDSGFGGGGGRSSRRQGPPPGNDLQVKVSLSLKEISEGVTKKIKIKRQQACKPCDGKGGTGVSNCRTCNGQGQVRQVTQSLFGQMVNVTTCPECNGIGTAIKSRCSSCNGEGRTREESTISVKIPPGVSEGNYLTLRGEGDAGRRGGRSGDIIVVILEKKDEFFERNNQDIYCTMDVPITKLVLGGTLRVPTLTEEVELKIPAGTQPDKMFRLRDKGIPEVNRNSNIGSQYIRIKPLIPTKLSSEEKELYTKLSDLHSDQEKSREKSFFANFKDVFS